MVEQGWLSSFCGAIRSQLPVDEANEILAGHEYQSEADMPALSQWLKRVIERMDELVGLPERTAVMLSLGHGCAEMNRDKHVDPVIARRMEFGSLDDYLLYEEANPSPGYRIQRIGDIVKVFYRPNELNTRCFCHVWHGLPQDEQVSLTWCGCSRGFIERLWEGILGKTPEVDLLCSAISGADACQFVVHL